MERVEIFSQDSLLIKSADIVSNASELLDDYFRYREEIFENFSAPKDKIIRNYLEIIKLILESWEDNPLKEDLGFLAKELQKIA